MKRILILILSIGFISFSCKKKQENVEFHFEYFPLEKGTFVEYDYTYIRHDHPIHEETTYRLKTVIGDTVHDNEGRVARKFYRYKLNDLTQQYELKDVWTAIIDGYRAELVEENQRKIKLVFAPTKDKEWDMNAFNSYPESYVYYEDLHKPYSVNQLEFENTLKVMEDSLLTLISYSNKFEVYAKNVGLIKKHYQDFTILNSDYTTPIKGLEEFYEVVSFGKE